MGSTKPEDIGTQRIFLSKLFELISTMCECSGDFFAERFRNDVWPTMASHLEYLLEELLRQREAYSPSRLGVPHHIIPATVSRKHKFSRPQIGYTVNHSSIIVKETSLLNKTEFSFKMSDTQRQLIASILKCLNRIIEQKECGKAIEKLLGPIGFILLPLLDIEDQKAIQELSMDCIKSIIRIDADVLRRPLMEISGTRIQPCPLKFGKVLRKNNEQTTLQMDNTNSSPSFVGSKTIVNRCHELLAFIDSLPEQVIR